ncbi:MAG: hypothetical protein ACI9BD_001512, partial [Candidatus Marinamargulisbacteria bacterium]
KPIDEKLKVREAAKRLHESTYNWAVQEKKLLAVYANLV